MIKKVTYKDYMFIYKDIHFIAGTRQELTTYAIDNKISDYSESPYGQLIKPKNNKDIYILIRTDSEVDLHEVLFHEMKHLDHYITRYLGKMGTRQLPVIGFGDEMYTRWWTWFNFHCPEVIEFKLYLQNISLVPKK